VSHLDSYQLDELFSPDWVCHISKAPCAIAASYGYLARLCRANGECLQPARADSPLSASKHTSASNTRSQDRGL